MNGRDARHVRFDFEHARAVQQAEALQAVLLAALVEPAQAGQTVCGVSAERWW